MQNENTTNAIKSNTSYCEWEQVSNNPDMFKVGCLGESSKGINIFKLCKKKHLNPMMALKTCAYCGKKISLKLLKTVKK